MIRRLYIHGFRCLVNFELELGPFHLFLGPNASGKSAVFDALQLLIAHATETRRVADIWDRAEYTDWLAAKPPIMRFELDLVAEAGAYHYALAVQFGGEAKDTRMAREELALDGRTLFLFDGDTGTMTIGAADGRDSESWPSGGESTGVGNSILSQRSAPAIGRFRETLKGVFLARPLPAAMATELSVAQCRRPMAGTREFARWFTDLATSPRRVMPLIKALEDVLPGFHDLHGWPDGAQFASLEAQFKQGDVVTTYDFAQLSHGQQMLTMLYTLALCGLTPHGTLGIDEPENFLALPEIQPWLGTIEEQAEEVPGAQVLLISHHPRILNFLADTRGIWFYREHSASPTRVKRIVRDEQIEGMTIAELVERGWLV